MRNSKRVKGCRICLAISIIGVVSFFSVAGHFWYVINKVLSGHGLDYFTTMWGYEFSYIGSLIFYVIFAIVMVLSPIIYWLTTADERSFKIKYHIDE